MNYSLIIERTYKWKHFENYQNTPVGWRLITFAAIFKTEHKLDITNYGMVRFMLI
jgi:hypothetical protein